MSEESKKTCTSIISGVETADKLRGLAECNATKNEEVAELRHQVGSMKRTVLALRGQIEHRQKRYDRELALLKTNISKQEEQLLILLGQIHRTIPKSKYSKKLEEQCLISD